MVGAAGRTQTTMLIQLSGNLSAAVDSALRRLCPAAVDSPELVEAVDFMSEAVSSTVV